MLRERKELKAWEESCKREENLKEERREVRKKGSGGEKERRERERERRK